MIYLNTSISDITKAIIKVFFSLNSFILLIWLIFVIVAPYLYFTTDYDDNVEKMYVFKDSHYIFDKNNGEKIYQFNVVDMDDDGISKTINVSEIDYNTQCDEEYFCILDTTIQQDHSTIFLWIGIILIVIIEASYLSMDDKSYWVYK